MTNESTWERPEILGWKEAEKGFWFNNITGESTWTRPVAVPLIASDGQSKYWLIDGDSTWEPPADFCWRSIVSAEPAQEGRVRCARLRERGGKSFLIVCRAYRSPSLRRSSFTRTG